MHIRFFLKDRRFFALGLVALGLVSCSAQPPTAGSPTATSATVAPAPTSAPTPAPTTNAVIALPMVGVAASTPALPAGSNAPVYRYSIVKTYPHDAGSYTEGLQYVDGFLYEGTGESGRSALLKVQLETGRIVQRQELAPELFGEGITVLGDRIYQLTWRSNVGFVYNRADLRQLKTFNYSTEGWGMTTDGTRLIMSDGTNTLYTLDPETLEQKPLVQVSDGSTPITNINELEYIDGDIYANIWLTDRIAQIDIATGRVKAWIDLSGLVPPSERANNDAVLNGIAYDAAGKRLFVTGKLWPKLFEIQIVK